MKRQLPTTLSLGDIPDLEAFIRSTLRYLRPRVTDREIEDLVADGFALAYDKHLHLAPGESLQHALTQSLKSRLQDRRRANHPEWRRNSRAATAYALPTPTGLACEHGQDPIGLAMIDEHRLTQSRLHLASVTNPTQLRDPRMIGRYKGVPSHAALPTGLANEIWDTIQAERSITDPPRPSSPPPPR
jgi:hypothetical protein